MCNSYRVKQKKGEASDLGAVVSKIAARLASSLVRKSDPGVVVCADGRVEIMRWGFRRSFNPSINNARSDKLGSEMWSESYRNRRCVIPVSLFYEWGAGIGGRKQAHEFQAADDEYLWIAGLWEEHAQLGPCFTMVTTDASPLMAPIHDRMPAILHPEEMSRFLSGEGPWNFQPFDGPLVINPCESPLAKRLPEIDPQQELF
jgi:putative SOS response-associated peptidase YedK